MLFFFPVGRHCCSFWCAQAASGTLQALPWGAVGELGAWGQRRQQGEQLTEAWSKGWERLTA